MRAVIFDLWDTLVEWSQAEEARLLETVAPLARLPVDEFERRLRENYRALQTRPLADVYRALGIPDGDLGRAVDAHHGLARRSLRLRAGASAVLAALRQRGIALGLITVCSQDVPTLWPETELAGLFDAETFSSECGLMKPEPEIYLRTARALGVTPAECMFVGDGANDELGGAERVGMRPVLFLPAGSVCRWPDLRSWEGMQVSRLEEVLQLC